MSRSLVERLQVVLMVSDQMVIMARLEVVRLRELEIQVISGCVQDQIIVGICILVAIRGQIEAAVRVDELAGRRLGETRFIEVVELVVVEESAGHAADRFVDVVIHVIAWLRVLLFEEARLSQVVGALGGQRRGLQVLAQLAPVDEGAGGRERAGPLLLVLQELELLLVLLVQRLRRQGRRGARRRERPSLAGERAIRVAVHVGVHVHVVGEILVVIG